MLWFVLALAWEGTNFVVCLHGGPLGSICCLAVGCACSLTSKEAYRRSAARRRRSSHTHTFALRLNRDPRSVGQCVSTTPARTHTHAHMCTQAIHMQDSCTLALLCSGPPVGVGRASLRRLWKGKLPLECPDARRRRRRRMRSTATEPEVAARDKPPEVPPCKD